MCDFGVVSGPMIMGAVTAATSAAAAASSIAAQSKQRSAMNTMEDRKSAAQTDLIAETRRRATQDYISQVQAEQLQQRQQEEGLAERASDLSRQTIKTQATAEASAAERNVAGRTVEQVINDYNFQADLEIGRLKENQKLSNLQHQRRIAGYGTEYDNRVTSIKPYVKTPGPSVDYFGPIFGAASQTLSYGVATKQIGDGNGFYGLGATPRVSSVPSSSRSPFLVPTSGPYYADGE